MAEPQETFMEASGVHVRTLTWEPGGHASDSRPALLLLHGLGGSAIQWNLVGASLARALDTRIIAIDLAGFGMTRAVLRSSTVTANARLVREVLAQVGPSILVGNSMGGAVAVRAARLAETVVRGLVLVTPTLPHIGAPSWPKPVLARAWPAALPIIGPLVVGMYARLVSSEDMVAERLRVATIDPGRVDPALRRGLVELAERRRSFHEGPRAYADAARSLFLYLGSPAGMAPDMRHVRVPVLILHGARDRLVPLSLAKATARRLPAWKLKVLDSSAHLPQVEQPEQFVQALEQFMDDVAADH